MAFYQLANIGAWTEKQLSGHRAIIQSSAQDVSELMVRPIDGLVRGAAFQEGFLPVGFTSQLRNSQLAAINGSVVSTGKDAYVAAIAGFDLGDSIKHVLTAPYARRIEYGWTTSTGKQVRGRFMVRGAVQNWERIVEENAKRLL